MAVAYDKFLGNIREYFWKRVGTSLLPKTTGDTLIINLNTATPAASLTGTALSARGADNSQVRIGYSSYGIGGVGAFAGRHARGTAASPSAVQNGDFLFGIEGWGYGATGYSVAPSAMIRGLATGTWTDASQPAKINFWTTPTGTIVPAIRMTIKDDGNSEFFNDILLPTTTSSVGRIQVNGTPFFNFYGVSNFFLGSGSGNYTFNTTYNKENVGIGTNCLQSLAGTTGIEGNWNIGIGYQCGKALTTGSKNIFMGYQAGASCTTAGANVYIGPSVGVYLQTGNGNVLIGSDIHVNNTVTALTNSIIIGLAAGNTHSGIRNLIIGYQAGRQTAGGDNTLIGYQAFQNNTYWDGARNTMLGYQCGQATSSTAGKDNVFLGYKSGYYETGNSKLFIDNAPRASEADARVKALMYGVFASTTAGQSLYHNSNVYISDHLYQPDSMLHYFGTGNDMSIGYNGTQGDIKTDLVAASDLHIDCGTDKTVVLDETVWDDLPPVPLITSKVGANSPTPTTFVGNIQQYTFDATNDEVFGATEITHQYKEGTDIEVHVHWATNGLEVGSAAVKWELEYTTADGDGSAPFAYAFAGSTVISAETTIPANTPDRSHIITTLGTITGVAAKIGAYICWRFRRIASTGTAPAADPFGLAIGFHVEQDTLGSRQTYVK